MLNIARQCKKINCYLDGRWLSGDIEAFNVPNLEILTINADAPIPRLDIELKMRGAGRELLEANSKPNTKLEIRAEHYREAQQASWKCIGMPVGEISQLLYMPTQTLRLNANAYKHVIDGKEKYYIDILNYIRRINGRDYRARERESLGIETPPDRL